jgi:hypothetical protein
MMKLVCTSLTNLPPNIPFPFSQLLTCAYHGKQEKQPLS